MIDKIKCKWSNISFRGQTCRDNPILFLSFFLYTIESRWPFHSHINSFTIEEQYEVREDRKMVNRKNKSFRWKRFSSEKFCILIIVLCMRRTVASLYLSSMSNKRRLIEFWRNSFFSKDIHLQNWTNPCEPNPCRAGICELVSKLTFSCHCIPVSKNDIYWNWIHDWYENSMFMVYYVKN